MKLLLGNQKLLADTEDFFQKLRPFILESFAPRVGAALRLTRRTSYHYNRIKMFKLTFSQMDSTVITLASLIDKKTKASVNTLVSDRILLP